MVEKENAVAAAKAETQTAETPLTAEEQQVLDARIYGGRMALKWTAVVPLTMAVGYLILLLYFRATGGYKQVHITAADALRSPIPTVER